jgi:hypothetical protein
MTPTPRDVWTKALFADRLDEVPEQLVLARLGKPDNEIPNGLVYRVADGDLIYLRDRDGIVRIKK